MEIIKTIIEAFKAFFAALREFLMGIKGDKIESMSKFADKLGGLLK